MANFEEVRTINEYLENASPEDTVNVSLSTANGHAQRYVIPVSSKNIILVHDSDTAAREINRRSNVGIFVFDWGHFEEIHRYLIDVKPDTALALVSPDAVIEDGIIKASSINTYFVFTVDDLLRVDNDKLKTVFTNLKMGLSQTSSGTLITYGDKLIAQINELREGEEKTAKIQSFKEKVLTLKREKHNLLSTYLFIGKAKNSYVDREIEEAFLALQTLVNREFGKNTQMKAILKNLLTS